MRSLRRQRTWICGWLVTLLLAMQWATAAYACPKLADRAPSAAVTMPGCSGDMAAMDAEQPQLCKAHCDAGSRTVNSGAGIADLPLLALHAAALVGMFDPLAAAALAAAMPAPSAAGPPRGSPPIYLTLHVLRN